MWEIYDNLIETIPEDIEVKDICVGLHFTMVKSVGIGIAMNPLNCNATLENAGKMHTLKLRTLAEYIKSWNFYEAAIGLAAINSYNNVYEKVEREFGVSLRYPGIKLELEYFKEEFINKNVALIGHFHFTEDIKNICNLTILERIPQSGDLPDSACEYVLKDQDYIVITATTLINKTLPRLLEICKGKKVIMIGPSLPLAKCLLKYNIDMLCGRVILSPEKNDKVLNWIKEGGKAGLRRCWGIQVRITK